jgi:hypothetical protein
MTSFSQKWNKMTTFRPQIMTNFGQKLNKMTALRVNNLKQSYSHSAGAPLVSPTRFSSRLVSRLALLSSLISSLGWRSSRLVSRLAAKVGEELTYWRRGEIMTVSSARLSARGSARTPSARGSSLGSRLGRVNKWRVNYDEFWPRIMTNFGQELWRISATFMLKNVSFFRHFHSNFVTTTATFKKFVF